MSKKIIFILLIAAATIIIVVLLKNLPGSLPADKSKILIPDFKPDLEEPSEITIQISDFNPVFRFSARIKKDWQIEPISQINAINIFDSKINANSNLEKSIIFIRYFEANDFLTLSTVNILKKENKEINSHQAVSYEIVKKDGVPNFPYQPLWRNLKHQVTDIRFSKNKSSLFYVFASNPSLSAEEFNDFISSLKFHNDQESFYRPISKASQRITKKTFGTRVSPDNSLVQPERFSGFHTGLDFEIFEDEQNQDITVNAVCGGKLISKQNLSGYGGVAVQECLINNQVIKIIYGHLKLSSIQTKISDYLSPKRKIGILGKSQSPETDGERKHLHLGIHKGDKNDLRGYVKEESDLQDWINPLEIIVLEN